MATIIRLDRMPNPHPISVKHKEKDGLENGAFLGVTGFAANERECYEVDKLTEGNEWAILACSVLQHDERLDERDFKLTLGAAGRAYIPQKGEVYTIAKTHFDGDLVVGSKLQLKDASYKIMLQPEVDAGVAVAKVRRLTKYSGQDSIQIEIL
ncbi:hypothetical protein [Metaclostridioides mangenotii]|uniref:hypothetical protein n=1 Tax=Metaclostridioides mangenotii TaxID=1540 RepID=UPI000466658A|nr:hypothetical protein [Clostridioides mangenotii]